MPTTRKRIRVYATDAEESKIKETAERIGLSVSQFLLRLGMDYTIPKAEDFVAWRGIQDLLKVNADLARLGNLLKLAIDERPDQVKDFARLIRDIDQTQKHIKETAAQIRGQVQAKRK